MRRDVPRLANRTFDLVVIGGGIYGACVAWDAALRGLSVALLEQGDFGQATSANSHRIVHGGLRYLQSGDLLRLREAVRERRRLLLIAPHFVRPLPFVLPVYRGSLRGRAVMAAALAVNDLLSCDRNRGVSDAARRIPRGHILSAEDCLRLAPGLAREGLTGGALWHDGQISNSERLTLAVVRAAAEAGAAVANYVRVTGLLRSGSRVDGVHAADQTDGRTFTVRARLSVGAVGPWTQQLWSAMHGAVGRQPLRWLKSMVLVTRPLPAHTVALGLPVRRRHSAVPGLLFATPWRGRTIVGTATVPYDGEPGSCTVSEAEIRDLLDDVNAAYPGAALLRRDVLGSYAGLIPAGSGGGAALQHARIFDHARLHGLEGVISVLGVKYTTAQDVARKTVDLVCAKLGRSVGSPRRETPIWGGEMEVFERFLTGAVRERLWELEEPVIRHLVGTYGTGYTEVLNVVRDNLAWAEPLPGCEPILKAEVIHAVRHEMALTLADVIHRRTELGLFGTVEPATLRVCAELMASELGWDESRMARELSTVRACEPVPAGRDEEPASAVAGVAGRPPCECS